MKKRTLLYTAAVIALLLATMALSGCSACSRDLASSIVEPIESMMPEPSSIPGMPEYSEPPYESESPYGSGSTYPDTLSEPPASSDVPASAALPALSMSADFSQIGALGRESVKWGPGVRQDERGRSADCVALQEKYGGYGVDFIALDRPVVTLTFDQGYENGYTASILDTLKEKGVQGVFFLTGHYVRSQPELVQRMVDEGHILGNHTNNHLDFTACSLEEAFEDAKWMQDHMRDTYGYEMRLFRYPEGKFNEQALALVQQMGYRTLFWSFAYADWDPGKQMSPEAAMEKVTSFLHPGEIMLLHTVGETNSIILPELIDAIRDAGYEVRPYDEIADF